MSWPQRCKRWPYKAHLLIAVVAFDGKTEFEVELVIAVIDSTKGRVVKSLRKTIEQDAVTEVGRDSFRIDTARYQLAPGIRAFGVELMSSARGPSCSDGWLNGNLTLYTLSSRSLQRVASLYLYRQWALQGCMQANFENSIWEDADISLSLGEQASYGLRDLVVNAKIEVIRNESDASLFKDHRNRVETHILRFDGKVYRPRKDPPWWVSSEND
jgi:hypothetical protein